MIHGAFSDASHLNGWRTMFENAGLECHVPTLPGHDPRDTSGLAGLTMEEYCASLRLEIGKLQQLPILLGHSMGGLLAQQLASEGLARALVCVATVPPWPLVSRLRAMPHLAPYLPSIILGVPFRPSDATLSDVVLHDLPEEEQAKITASLHSESGVAYRQMLFGTARLPAAPFRGPTLCLGGLHDRVVPPRTTTAIAELYGLEPRFFDRGHWLIAGPATNQTAAEVLNWMQSTPALNT
jgi:pimeloyl-ACP methyl ester carboxylesterase